MNLNSQSILLPKILNSILNGNQRILLKGPSGSGKSFIAESIAEQWIKSGQHHFVFFIKGDKNKTDEYYFPYTEKINEIRNKKSFKTIFKKSIVELTKSIPVGGDLVSYLVETLSNNKQEKKKDILQFFNETEKLIVLDIDKLFNKNNTLLIIDNIQWLDDGSLKITEILAKGNLSESFDSFNNLNILCTYSGNDDYITERNVNEFVLNFNFDTYNIPYLKQEEFLNALRSFGFDRGIDENLIALLYSIIGGHLVLIKALAEYLISQPTLQQVHEYDIFNSQSNNSIIEKLLTYKLKIMGASSEQAIDILKYASIIGLSFNIEELECLSEIKKEKIIEYITKSQKALLIDGNEKNNVFKHEIIREFFLERLSNEKYKYYYRFAECLRKLRPSDYLIRAKYLFDSGHLDEAIPIYIIAVLKNVRDGMHTSEIIINRIVEFTEKVEIKDFYEKMVLAYDNFLKGKYRNASTILNSIEDFYALPLIAEKYYLLSLCSLKSMHIHELKISIEYLKTWDDLKEDEPEIWVRIMSTLMTIRTDSYNYDEGKKIERELTIFLAKRSKFDSSALINLNIIRRKASALHISELAYIRTKQSTDFFSEIDNSNSLVNPVQYYLSLINCSGNLISLGEYEEALNYSKQGLDLINEYLGIAFPESHICANNYIISGLLAKVFEPNQAIFMFNALNKNGDLTADKILIQNNYAIAYVYNNELKKAHDIWKKLFASTKKDDLDPYYIYFISINYASLLFLLGNFTEAKRIWKNMNSKIPNVPDKVYIETRHNLLAEVINSSEKMDWKVWDEYLSLKNSHTLGKAWKFYGRGFLLSDLQLWHES